MTKRTQLTLHEIRRPLTPEELSSEAAKISRDFVAAGSIWSALTRNFQCHSWMQVLPARPAQYDLTVRGP